MAKRAIVVAFGLVFASLDAQDSKQSAEPSKPLTQLLAEIKGNASSLKRDISTLDFFATANEGFGRQSGIVEVYKGHIAALRDQAARLEEIRKNGSGSQQLAVDRILPVMQELASSAEAAIRAGQTGQERLNHPEYREYFKLNADLAGELSSVISAWVDYAGTRGALDLAGRKLAPASALP